MAICGVPRGYTLTEGTLFAGPVIAGLAACLLEARPDASAEQVRWWAEEGGNDRHAAIGSGPTWGCRIGALACEHGPVPPARRVSCFEVYRRVQEIGWNERLQRMQDRPAEVLLNCLPRPARRKHWRALRRFFGIVRDPRGGRPWCCCVGMGSRATISVVEAALHSRSPLVLGAALEVLRAGGKVDECLRGRLRELINHPDHAVRYEAIRVGQVRRTHRMSSRWCGMAMDLDRWQWAAFVARMQCLGKMTGTPSGRGSRKGMRPGECVFSAYWMSKRRVCAARWTKWLSRRTGSRRAS